MGRRRLLIASGQRTAYCARIDSRCQRVELVSLRPTMHSIETCIAVDQRVRPFRARPITRRAELVDNRVIAFVR